ncbi:T9SS type A sorting domain-containing protein [bacterium]|nr:T9SS type A sorting domain-containing protein [bacterium]
MRTLSLLSGILLLVASTVLATTIERQISFPAVQVSQSGQYDEIKMDGLRLIGEPGEPVLPTYAHTIVLPAGEVLSEVILTNAIWEEFNQAVTPVPGANLFPISSGQTAELTPNPAIYRENDIFPQNIITDIQTGFLRGHAIGSFLVKPVRWNPQTGIFEYLVEATFQIETQSDQSALDALSHLRRDAETARLLEKSVLDREYALSYPNVNHELDEVPLDLLIICANIHVDAWEEYAEFKRLRGTETLILTTADIYQDFDGADNQAKIRAAIDSYYITMGTNYVILGGDVQYIPYRGMYDATAGEEDYNIPADVYYAGLDGNWNTDGDNRWGESNEADLYQEICIGRAPVSSDNMIEVWIHKQIMYQSQPVVDEVTNGLMVGEDLGWVSWGGEYKDEVRLGSNNYGYNTAGFPDEWDVGTLYDMDAVWNIQTLFNRLNSGVNLVNHLGHANVPYMLKADINDITDNTLLNDGVNHQFYMLYSQGCYCGAFEQNSIAERWNTINHGAFAMIANSRYGWGSGNNTDGPSQHYDREFFDALFAEDIYEVGAANRDSKHECIPYINGSCMRWVFYELNLFGDPSVKLYTSEVQELQADIPDLYIIGEGIYIASLPGIEGARVAISRDGNLLAVGDTDRNGDVVIPIDINEVGTLTVQIVAQNYLPYTEEITAILPEGGYPMLVGVEVDDEEFGNNNQRADFGEELDFVLEVRNVGQDDLGEVLFSLESLHADVTVDDVETTIPNLESQETVFVSIRAFISTTVINATKATFQVRMMVDEEELSTTFSKDLYAPELKLLTLWINDEQGNGNSRMESGETAGVGVCIENSGGAMLDNAMVSLSCNDPSVSNLILEPQTIAVPFEDQLDIYNLAQVTIAENVPTPSRTWILVEITRDDGYEFRQFLPLELNGFADDLESIEQPWEHYAVNDNEDQWHLSLERNHTRDGVRSWKAGGDYEDYADDTDAALELPPIDRDGPIVLSFYHWMDAEISGNFEGECYDGGRIELSPDGENWMPLPMQSYNYVTRGDGPFGEGERVFSGQFDWTYEEFTIQGDPGTIFLRFRFGSDRGTTAEGWYIDDVQISMPSTDTAPSGLAATSEQNLVTLTWQSPVQELDDVDQLRGFFVYRDGEVVSDLVINLEYVDDLLEMPMGEYIYTVSAVYEQTGESAQCEPFLFEYDYNAVADKSANLPSQWSVSQGYPNPFNPSVTFDFAVPRQGKIEFGLYNVLGQLVYSSENVYSAGVHHFVFHTDMTDLPLVSGIYFANFRYESSENLQKVILVK